VDPAGPPVVPAALPEPSSASRVRSAAPKPGAPWTPASGSGRFHLAAGGSGGIRNPDRQNHGTDTKSRPFLFPIRLSDCFQASRFTVTSSSWTALFRGSRKWMSGLATPLALSNHRRLGTSCFSSALLDSF
jgi:hypothetical protein